MNFFSTMILALAMSTDAFAAAVGKGTALRNPRISEALRTGVIFGVIEAITPLIGWALGSIAAEFVADWDHWIAFGLLLVLGAWMIRSGLRADEPEAAPAIRHSFWLLAATGFAISVDAMAVGVSLAFVDNNILVTAVAIGLATLLMVTLGVMVGRLIGKVAGKWAEVLGGLALMGVGAAILYEHLTM
ncbi:MAG: manganese efflux pump MntP [Burkholderiaceae bacterium]